MKKKKMAINGETHFFFPEEIMIDILKRLPVKSLKRFQCVCKDWKNLFKTPYFIQQHLHHSTHNNSSLVIAPTHPKDDYFLLSFNWELKFREIEIPPFIGSISGLRLVGCSNGLLCFTNSNKRPAALLVWNPATREVRRVPIISDEFRGLNCCFGFGFSPIINDYRIVRFSSRYSVICKVEVFSLSTGGWRDIEFHNIKDVCIFPASINGDAVTANGVMFFRALNSIMAENETFLIVSFDLATEVFTVVQWPAFASYFGKLAVCGDKLAIITNLKIMPPMLNSEEGLEDGASSTNHGVKEKDHNSEEGLEDNASSTFQGVMDDENSMYFEVMEEEAINSSGKRWSSSKKYSGTSQLNLSAGTIWRNQIVCIDFGLPSRTTHGVEGNGRLYLIDVNAERCKRFNIPRPKPGFGVCVFNYVESLVPVSGNIHIEEP